MGRRFESSVISIVTDEILMVITNMKGPKPGKERDTTADYVDLLWPWLGFRSDILNITIDEYI